MLRVDKDNYTIERIYEVVKVMCQDKLAMKYENVSFGKDQYGVKIADKGISTFIPYHNICYIDRIGDVKIIIVIKEC